MELDMLSRRRSGWLLFWFFMVWSAGCSTSRAPQVDVTSLTEADIRAVVERRGDKVHEWHRLSDRILAMVEDYRFHRHGGGGTHHGSQVRLVDLATGDERVLPYHYLFPLKENNAGLLAALYKRSNKGNEGALLYPDGRLSKYTDIIHPGNMMPRGEEDYCYNARALFGVFEWDRPEIGYDGVSWEPAPDFYDRASSPWAAAACGRLLKASRKEKLPDPEIPDYHTWRYDYVFLDPNDLSEIPGTAWGYTQDLGDPEQRSRVKAMARQARQVALEKLQPSVEKAYARHRQMLAEAIAARREREEKRQQRAASHQRYLNCEEFESRAPADVYRTLKSNLGSWRTTFSANCTRLFYQAAMQVGGCPALLDAYGYAGAYSESDLSAAVQCGAGDEFLHQAGGPWYSKVQRSRPPADAYSPSSRGRESLADQIMENEKKRYQRNLDRYNQGGRPSDWRVYD